MASIIGAREDDLLRDDSDLLQRVYKMIPNQTQDMIAMFIFLVLLPPAFLFELFYVIGDQYAPWTSPWLIRAGALSLLFANCYINYSLMVRIGPNGRKNILPNVVQAGFRYCHSCRNQAPPRAYHCPVCDVCIFRRDHHCSFGGVCVGHFNHRYFFAAVANLWCAVIVLPVYNWWWLMERLGGHFSIMQIWQLVLPHVALVARLISFAQFLSVMVFSFSAVVAAFVTYLVAAQVFCIWRGQTRVEYLLEIHAYQLGFFDNIKNVMGSGWLGALIFPFFPSQLPSNGMHFETREAKKHHHDEKSM